MSTRILIADGESVMRMSIRTMVDWEKEDCEIVGDVQNGNAALTFIKQHAVDVLLTDIRMPGMDGIEFLKHVSALETPPATVVLSAYKDFNYVRQAFKQGAADYLLKSDMTPASLLESVQNASRRTRHIVRSIDMTLHKSEHFRRVVMGVENPSSVLNGQEYLLAGFEVDNWGEQIKRFGGNMEYDFVRPMINYAEQVPRIASGCYICDISSSQYVLCCTIDRVMSKPKETFISICEQIIRNWKNCMDVDTTAGISVVGYMPNQFGSLLNEAWRNLSLKSVLGRGNVYNSTHLNYFSPINVQPYNDIYNSIAESIKHGQLTHDVQSILVATLYNLNKREAIERILGLIYYISTCFIKAGDDILYALDPRCNYYEKLERLHTVRDMEIWLDNVLRWLNGHVEYHYKHKQADVIERAKQFIADHYCDPAISLVAVAKYVGLSEKYFSTRFNKETNQPFSVYINELRIAKAKKLMNKTDLKIYEICNQIGFNNVEHFTRVFKKFTGVTPSSYKLLGAVK